MTVSIGGGRELLKRRIVSAETTDFQAAFRAKSPRNADRSFRICFREETCFSLAKRGGEEVGGAGRALLFLCVLDFLFSFFFVRSPTTYTFLFYFAAFFINNIENTSTERALDPSYKEHYSIDDKIAQNSLRRSKVYVTEVRKI